MLATLVVFLPLIGSITAGIIVFMPSDDKDVQSRRDSAAQIATCTGLVLSAICAIFVFKDVALDGNAYTQELFTWLDSGTLEVSWALKVDTLTAVMMIVVTVVSAMVHIYSIGYMHHDNSIPRFMCYLSLFTFFMLMLVTASNLMQMFFGWEGVGLASYLLIGFWYNKPSANAAAIKAFLVNRVGDFGFALGIFTVFMLFDSIHLDSIFAAAEGKKDAMLTVFGGEFHALTVACLLLFVGAMGKSAQLGLHTWLPDAMEGPTPVSALIHAATMVTAGVFMVARLSPLFEYSETALTVVTLVGGSTAIFAATVACVQNDIKRVIAYSTCSQLGYMFFAAGVSAYSAGIFHLMTHGFFKALLFLGAGSVIHAMHHEQDMRNMGGLWRKIPFTAGVMIIGTLAITGVPGFAGYFSKDLIIEAAYASDAEGARFAFVMGVSAALMTSFYSWRLIFMTFFGKTRAKQKYYDGAHEGPMAIKFPLAVLALGAIAAGFLFDERFIGGAREVFWNGALVTSAGDIMDAAKQVPSAVVWAPFVVMVIGLLLAYQLYMRRTDLPAKIAETWDGLYAFLLNKWYFDELYDYIFVRPAFWLGRLLWKRGDEQTIDGFGPDGVSSAVAMIAAKARKLQSGYVYHYAFAMIIGLAVIVTWFMAQSGAH